MPKRLNCQTGTICVHPLRKTNPASTQSISGSSQPVFNSPPKTPAARLSSFTAPLSLNPFQSLPGVS